MRSSVAIWRDRRGRLSALRVVMMSAGEVLMRKLQERMPQVSYVSNYGMTEATGHVSMTCIDDPPDVRLTTAGTAPGSIIAAIIDTHTMTKNPNEPSGVATPMSIPLIRRTATTQDAQAIGSVTISATGVAAALPRTALSLMVIPATRQLP